MYALIICSVIAVLVCIAYWRQWWEPLVLGFAISFLVTLGQWSDGLNFDILFWLLLSVTLVVAGVDMKQKRFANYRHIFHLSLFAIIGATVLWAQKHAFVSGVYILATLFLVLFLWHTDVLKRRSFSMRRLLGNQHPLSEN